MNAQSFYLTAALIGVIVAALAVSLWIGRKVPTLHQRKQLDLDAYRAQEATLEADLDTRKHQLNACRAHINRLSKQLAKADSDKAIADAQSDAKIMHIVGRAKK